MKKELSQMLMILMLASTLVVTAVSINGGFWQVKMPMITARAMAGSAVFGSKIYVIGGQRYSGDAVVTNEVYDPATDSWNTAADLPIPKRYPYVEVVNGKIYVIGGDNDPLGWIVGTSNYIYDPVIDQWTSGTPIPFKQGNAASVVANNKIYIFGGYTPEYHPQLPLDFNQAYDPTTDSWLTSEWGQLAPLPTPRRHLAAAVVDNKIYVIGGEIIPSPNNAVPVGINEMYNPSTDTWTTKASMPTPRSGLSLAVLNSEIYAIGGVDQNHQISNTVEKYNPETDSWEEVESMPTARGWLATEVVSETIYAIGGWTGSASSANEAFTQASPALVSNIDIKPSTLNLRSRGRWITSYVELPEGYNEWNYSSRFGCTYTSWRL